jgi:Mn2+/Fe2+ NRAMP family transporter
VAVSGATIDLSSHAANPAGQAFGIALGSVGLRIFGVVFWGAAISSVIGNAYTSVSFLSTFHSAFRRSRPLQFGTVVFIIVSLAIYLSIGTPPAQLLIFAGGLNGLILPIGLSVLMFIGWARPKLLKVSSYPKWLLISGSLVTLLMWYTAIVSIGPIFSLIGL